MNVPHPDPAALWARLAEIEARLANEPDCVLALSEKAQLLARLGRNDEAKDAFVAVLMRDPGHFGALTDLAALALASGHRSAALTAYRQAVAVHPDNPFGLVNLANLLLEDEAVEEAGALYERALAVDSALAYAHQGLAAVKARRGDEAGAAYHRELGFRGHSLVTRPYRGEGEPVRVLLLVSVKGGNIPTGLILDDRLFAVTALYVEFDDAAKPLPVHDVIFNAVGDADLCADALDHVAAIAQRSGAPVLNRAEAVRATGRVANAARLGGLAEIVAPRTVFYPKSALAADGAGETLRRDGFAFPLLLRAPGFHTGQHFQRVENAAALAAVVREIPGDALLAIEFLDLRGPDGMARKYRVMFIGNDMLPLHLALSASWKVHYFTSGMADDIAYRREEESFLRDMAGHLGARALSGLEQVRAQLSLDYGGVDFALAADGRLAVFEANATMTMAPPPPGPIWDYRRAPIAAAIAAAQALVFRKAGRSVPARS